MTFTPSFLRRCWSGWNSIARFRLTKWSKPVASAPLESERRRLPLPVRALAAFSMGVVLVLSQGCNSSDPEVSAGPGVPPDPGVPSDPAELCKQLTPNLANGPCGANAWSDLSTWRVTQTRLDTGYLNFVTTPDPIQAAALQAEQGFQASGRADLPFWPLSLPLNWDADPFKDTNWRFQLQAWRMVDPLVLAWLQTGDTHYLDDALVFVEDWHSYHIEQRLPSQYGWYDMATGIRAMKLAFLLDRAMRGEFELDVRGQSVLLELAELHVRKLLEPAFLSTGNHGLFQVHGLVALCSTVPYLKSCGGALAYAETHMQDLLSRQFSSEGVHLEHSPEYHLFVSATVQGMLGSGWYKNFEYIQHLMPEVQANRVWMLDPDRSVVAVGDSVASRYNLSFPAGDDTCVDVSTYQSRCYLLQAFSKSGYAVVRSDWAIPEVSSSMLFFMASFHSAAHKHADDLSFDLFEFGERLLTDTGKSSYNSDKWRDFAVSTRAHNALEIDGRSSSTRLADAYGSALRQVSRQGDAFALEGVIQHANSGVTQRRRLFYTPRLWLLVVDDLAGASVATVTQWFHFAKQVQVTGPLPGPGAKSVFDARLRSGRLVQLEQLLPGCPSTLSFGSSSPIQGWETESYGHLVPRHTVGFTCTGNERAFATLLLLDPERRDQALADANAILKQLGLRP